MPDHVSERFYDSEQADAYLELLQSSMDHPQSCEHAWLLEQLSPVAARAPHRIVARPHLALRWCKLPQIPLPFLTWA